MPRLNLVLENLHPAYRVDKSALRRLVQRVLAGEQAAARYVGVILADHATVHDLNRTWLHHDYDTDVVSFRLSNLDQPLEGEVYVDLDTAAERHAEFGATFAAEVERYVVHGLLHLVGYDDATPPEKAVMHALEDHYLAPVS